MAFEFTGTVQTVEIKTAKTGKTYYRLNIPQDGSDRWHSSFDSKVTGLQGQTITYNADKTQYGWNLKEYEIAAAPAAVPEQAQASRGGGKSNRENVWIATQGFMQRAIDVGYCLNMVDALYWFRKTLHLMEALWDRDEGRFNSLMNDLELEQIQDVPEQQEE